MNKRTSAGQNPGIISIPTLKDGVGRQAPSKRLPTEVENLDNVRITLERSAEKRPGFEILRNTNSLAWSADFSEEQPAVPPVEVGVYDTPTSEKLSNSTSVPTWFFWFELSENDLFLIQVSYLSSSHFLAAAAETPVITIIRVNNNNTWESEHVIKANDMTAEAYNYLMYSGSTTFTNNLKAVNIGADVLILNNKVKAGFSSTLHPVSGEWRTFGLDGVQTTTEDIRGRKVEYKTSLRVDPVGSAAVALTGATYFKDDIVYRAWQGTSAIGGVYICTEESRNTSEAAQNIPPNPGTHTVGTDYNGWDYIRGVDVVNVEDNTYVDPTTPKLGQAVNSFRDLPFPPVPENWIVASGITDTTDRVFDWIAPPYSVDLVAPADTIALLYDEWDGTTRTTSGEPSSNGTEPLGRGKIYYCKNSFLEAPPGWYRVISDTESPYYSRVRSPYELGSFDENRMPHRLKRQSDGTWTFEAVEWDFRMAGSVDNNPGPSIFKDGQQTNITDMATFQNRLYFSAGDTVFSSRLGDFTDFWIKDPGNLTDSDPIDTTLSTNSYAEVSYMIPFRDELFIVTRSNTQFTLTGYENVISPFTVEVQPVSFFSTENVTNPVTVGNSVYFTNNRRMYMYYPQSSEVGQTMEMSKHCPDYLPKNPRGLHTATANESMFVLSDNDPDNQVYPHHVYGYTSRFTGNEMVQNAFWRWKLDTDKNTSGFFSRHNLEVLTAYTKDNYLYFVFSCESSVEIPTTTPSEGLFIGRIFLQEEAPDKPRMDHRLDLTQTGSPNWIYFTQAPSESFSTILVDSLSALKNLVSGPLLIEDFDTYPQGQITVPYTLTSTGLEIDVVSAGEFTASISPATVFSSPQSGPSHFTVYFTEDSYYISVAVPQQAYAFGAYISGYGDLDDSGSITLQTYLAGSLQETVVVPLTSGPGNKFVGFLTDTPFDEVRFLIEATVDNSDFVGIDSVAVGYNPPGEGTTWFCVPAMAGTLETVWFGEGWGELSYTERPIVSRLDRSNSNKPSWVAVSGKYDAPIINDVSVTPTFTVANTEDLDSLTPNFGNTAYVSSTNLVYTFLGSWVLSRIQSWVSNKTGTPTDLSAKISFGRKYNMVIELSQQFIRDQENNAVEGVLSMRHFISRHRNTGKYTVRTLSLNNVERTASTFTGKRVVDLTGTVLGIPVQRDGELVSKVFGFSERSVIQIESFDILPVNITNITIRGKFRAKNSTFLS